MRLTKVLNSLRDVLSPMHQSPIKIPTSKYEEMMNQPKVQSQILKDSQRKLYDMGELIHDVQMSKQFKTSKAFMDMKMRYPFLEVLKHYKNLKLTFGPGKIPPPFVIMKFLNDNFEVADDMQRWSPTDWTPTPKILEKIKDPAFRKFAEEVNGLWKNLGRKVNENVKVNKDMYMTVYVSNGFIATSSELSEMYYWHSYWITRGLLACQMYKTAKGIIENFIQLLDQFHYVPRSNRTYHLNQTSIPTLILMVDAYINATGDRQFLKENIEILEKELVFWRYHRSLPITVKNSTYNMYRFTSSVTGPRPEQYRSDYKFMSAQAEAPVILSGLRAAEESGWNFSSRWIDVQGGNEGTVYDVKTQEIIPVDLNAIIQKNFRILSTWYRAIGDDKKTGHYELLAEELLIAINKVLWQEQFGMWCDYNFTNMEPRRYHYLSNFTPVWTESHSFDKSFLSSILLRYISNQKLIYYEGVPVSLEFSGETWDFPNVLPTALAVFLEGLDNLGTKEASKLAQLMAEIWLESAATGYTRKQAIYQYYDSLRVGERGAMEEEEIALDHGDTIAVIMIFLDKWGDLMRKSSPKIPMVGK